MTKQDWTRGRMRYELEKKGRRTWREIDLEYGFPVNTISNTMYRPDPRGEKVLADILGLPPQEIWPSRYDATGRRLKPQPNCHGTPAFSKDARKKWAAA
jgi:Ner family transcriptional regulator